jgi:hypothetical protein
MTTEKLDKSASRFLISPLAVLSTESSKKSNKFGEKIGKIFCLLCLVLASCSDARNENPPTYRVIGKVMYQGKPVPDATLLFQKKDQSRGAVGETDAEGNFQLTTYALNDGAPPGEYRVSIMCYRKPKLNASESEMYHLKNDLPAKYEDPLKSGLSAKVVDNDNNVVNFELN